MRIKKECSLLLKVNVLLIFNKLPFKEEERTQKTITFICNQLKLNIMSLKYSTTTADYLRWDEMSNLVRRLSRDGDYKMSLLIAIGCFWGLRISDILSLRWKDILNVDEFTLQEKKTKKNPQRREARQGFLWCSDRTHIRTRKSFSQLVFQVVKRDCFCSFAEIVGQNQFIIIKENRIDECINQHPAV